MPLNSLTLNSPSAAATRSADEVEGPGAADVSPKYFSNAPEKIIHEIIIIYIIYYMYLPGLRIIHTKILSKYANYRVIQQYIQV